MVIRDRVKAQKLAQDLLALEEVKEFRSDQAIKSAVSICCFRATRGFLVAHGKLLLMAQFRLSSAMQRDCSLISGGYYRQAPPVGAIRGGPMWRLDKLRLKVHTRAATSHHVSEAYRLRDGAHP
jgi:hypothetical protein